MCLILCRALCLILCPSQYQREFQNRYPTTQTVKYQPITYTIYKICNIMNNISVFKNAEHQGYILIAYCETSFYRYNYPFKLLILAQTLCTWSIVAIQSHCLASVTIRSIFISLHSFGRQNPFKIWIFHKKSSVYLGETRKKHYLWSVDSR